MKTLTIVTILLTLFSCGDAPESSPPPEPVVVEDDIDWELLAQKEEEIRVELQRRKILETLYADKYTVDQIIAWLHDAIWADRWAQENDPGYYRNNLLMNDIKEMLDFMKTPAGREWAIKAAPNPQAVR